MNKRSFAIAALAVAGVIFSAGIDFAADPTLDRGTVRFVNRDGTEAGRIVNLKVERDAR